MINELNNPGTTQRTPRGITQVSSAEAVVSTIANLCRSIDYVKDTGAKGRHCNDLQKILTENNAPAHEWQSYYIRCQY